MISIVPNLIPIGVVMGIMGWSGISLNIGTVMVSSVAFGIAVDDTIHFLARLRKEIKSVTTTIKDALEKTTVFVGRAVLFTSVINIAGFLIFVISDFKPRQEFGLLIAIILFIALIGDLFILPASIMAMRKYFGRNR